MDENKQEQQKVQMLQTIAYKKSHKEYKETLENTTENDISMSFTQLRDAMDGFTKTQLLIKNDDGAYVDFIEKKRQQERAENDRLEDLAKRRQLSEEEQQKLSETASAKHLGGDEYFALESNNPKNSNAFISENKDNLSWFEEYMNDFSKNLNSIQNNKNYEKMSPAQQEAMASMKVMTTNFPEMAQRGFSALKFAVNPVMFLSSKVAMKGIQMYMQSESGQANLKKGQELWAKKFGSGDENKNGFLKKGIVALAGIGAIALVVAGVDEEDLLEMKATLTESLDNVAKNAANNHLDHSYNSYSGLGNEALDAAMEETALEQPEYRDNTPRGAYNPEGDTPAERGETPESQQPRDNTPRGAYNPEGDTPEINEVNDAPEWPSSIEIEKGATLEGIAKGLLPEGASYSDIQEMTRKIAEFNGIEDADKIQAGMDMKIPSPDELDGIELRDFKLNSIEDLNNLDKLPYGTEITPESLRSDIKDILKETYPNEPFRINEVMAYFDQKFGNLPQGKPINSMEELNFGEITDKMFGENRMDISDERETAYDYEFLNGNEQDAPEQEDEKFKQTRTTPNEPINGAKTPQQMAEDMREATESSELSESEKELENLLKSEKQNAQVASNNQEKPSNMTKRRM